MIRLLTPLTFLYFLISIGNQPTTGEGRLLRKTFQWRPGGPTTIHHVMLYCLLPFLSPSPDNLPRLLLHKGTVRVIQCHAGTTRWKNLVRLIIVYFLLIIVIYNHRGCLSWTTAMTTNYGMGWEDKDYLSNLLKDEISPSIIRDLECILHR